MNNERLDRIERMQRIHSAVLPIIWVAIAYLLLAHLTGCAAPQWRRDVDPAVSMAILGNMQQTQRNQIDLWNAYQLSHPQIGIYGYGGPLTTYQAPMLGAMPAMRWGR